MDICEYYSSYSSIMHQRRGSTWPSRQKNSQSNISVWLYYILHGCCLLWRQKLVLPSMKSLLWSNLEATSAIELHHLKEIRGRKVILLIFQNGEVYPTQVSVSSILYGLDFYLLATHVLLLHGVIQVGSFLRSIQGVFKGVMFRLSIQEVSKVATFKQSTPRGVYRGWWC